MWQVTCKNCLGLGHRTTSPRCPLNGTKKRKSRAKKGKAGRPADYTKGDAAPSPSKRQKVNVKENPVNNNPGPMASTMANQMNTSPRRVTRSEMQLTMVEYGGSNQITTSPRAVTRSGEGTSNAVSTPRKRLGLKKKLTPRKEKKNGV